MGNWQVIEERYPGCHLSSGCNKDNNLLADRLKKIEKCENNVTEGLNEATVNTALQNKTTTEEYCKYVEDEA